MRLTDFAHLDASTLSRLYSEVEAIYSLVGALDWAAASAAPTPRGIPDIVQQDEFTFDIIVPLKAPLYLSFDCT